MSKTNQFSRGVLYSKKSEQNYDLTRTKPSGSFSELIETYWLVSWDLRGKQPHVQQNIPDPCVNMVFEADKSRIIGAVSQRYSATLAEKGKIFGLKFHPGGFYALSGVLASSFTNQSLPIDHVFDDLSDQLIANINSAIDIHSMIQFVEEFLMPKLPDSADNVNKIRTIISQIQQDSSITKVGQLADKTAMSTRQLQRLFKDQVGISPKWVIRKNRIQEILVCFENGETAWQSMALDLGYFDQAHFIKDFKNLVGVTPSNYLDGLGNY